MFSFGDHWLLVLLRSCCAAFAFLSFLLFFVGLGTQQWFKVTGMANMSFSMSPVKFCDSAGTCTDINWASMPAPPVVCAVSIAELQDRYRTVSAFTAIAGLLTIVAFFTTLFTFGKSRREAVVKHVGWVSAGSGSFGFIAAALWGYTVEDYQYCGTTFCSYARALSVGDYNCVEALGTSFNAVIVASTFMLSAALCTVAHQLAIPFLDVDASHQMDEEDEAQDEGDAANEKRFGPIVRNFREAQDVHNMQQQQRGGKKGGNMRRINERRQAYTTDEQYYGNDRNPTALSVAPRSGSFPSRGFQQQQHQQRGSSAARNVPISDGEELGDFRPLSRSRDGGGGGNNINRGGRQQQQQGQPHRQHQRNAWAPPRGSDYVLEPESGLYWSASRPDEYVDAKTGHILIVSKALWFDGQHYYEVESS